jgi:hypothetical protein
VTLNGDPAVAEAGALTVKWVAAAALTVKLLEAGLWMDPSEAVMV